MANNRLLPTVPEEIEVNEIPLYLDKKDILNVRQTSKMMNKLFQPASEVAKLLHFVQEADYDAAKKIVEANPELMFKYVSYKKTDDTYETISPLKFAFKVLDAYMWKMCYEKIKNTPLLKHFIQQLDEQRDHINLNPLYAEYIKYDDLAKFHRRYSQGSFVFDYRKLIDNGWFNVGKIQRNVLPLHMLKEFLHSGNSWNNQSKFDDEINRDEFGPFDGYSTLGADFALVRGKSGAVICKSPNINDDQNAALDCEIFRHLCEVRKNDLDKLRSELGLMLEKSNKMELK